MNKVISFINLDSIKLEILESSFKPVYKLSTYDQTITEVLDTNNFNPISRIEIEFYLNKFSSFPEFENIVNYIFSAELEYLNKQIKEYQKFVSKSESFKKINLFELSQTRTALQ